MPFRFKGLEPADAPSMNQRLYSTGLNSFGIGYCDVVRNLKNRIKSAKISVKQLHIFTREMK